MMMLFLGGEVILHLNLEVHYFFLYSNREEEALVKTRLS